jgi:pyruvate,water dikinase
MLALAGALLGDDVEADGIDTVLRGLPHNVTTQMDLELWRLAAEIREEPPAAELVRRTPSADLTAAWRAGRLPRIVQEGLSEFLDRYGHRAVAEIDLGLPRWSEDPEHILGALANYLRLDEPERAPDAVFARAAAEADAMVTALTARARRRSRLRGRIVGFALDRTRQLVGVRELPKYYFVLVLARMRRQLAAVGEELARAGRLAAPDEVFLLDLHEARAAVAGGDVADLVRQRRAEYERELRRRHVPRVLLSDGTEPEPRATGEPSADGALRGTPASAGSVTGTVRVVLDPVGARLEPGEILVAPSTDPGWTPLFLTAGGLVMEMGGPNSHGAVVAREYGIPAVVGVPDATTRLATGQRVTVDGSGGKVTPAEARDPA